MTTPVCLIWRSSKSRTRWAWSRWTKIRAKAEKAFPDILKAATEWKPAEEAKLAQAKPAYPAERTKFSGTYAELNAMFSQKHYGIDLPIVPPTVEAVQAMLKGTKHQPEEVAWVVPPRMGQLTVELVAAYGAMAGCKPEHMPLLLAVTKALSDVEYDWRGSTTTTAAASPLIVVNGPIVDKLKIGSGSGALAGGQPTNICVGYYVNLVGDVIGGSQPPDGDKSTHGTRGDLVAMVIGENEKANPWQQSFAVEHGFKPTDSVVSAMSTYPGTVNVDHNSVKGTDLLNSFSGAVAAVASGISSCYTKPGVPNAITGPNANSVDNVMLLISPEHAATIFTDFKTKQAVKEFLVKNAVLPFRMYAPDICHPPAEAGQVGPDTPLPRFTSTDSIHVIVTGGAGKQSQIWPNFPSCKRPISVKVEEE